MEKRGCRVKEVSIYDRQYMRSDYRTSTGGGRDILSKVLLVLVSGFIIQVLLQVAFGIDGLLNDRPDPRGFLRNGVALTVEGLLSFKVWTLLSYGLIHHSPLHLLFNGFGTFILWRALRDDFSEGSILQLYLAGIAVGGLVWFCTRLALGIDGLLLGASGGVLALLAVVCLCRWQEMAFLIFPPIPIRLKYLFFVALGFDLFGMLLFELRGGGVVAHSAHLGGFATGILFYRTFHASARNRARGLWLPIPSVRIKTSRTTIHRVNKPSYKVNLSQESEPAAFKAEVDRILDKINEKGFGSLTADERDVLQRAGSLLNR